MKKNKGSGVFSLSIQREGIFKRSVFSLLGFILILSVVGSFNELVHANENDYNWVDNGDGTVTITEYTGTDKDIVIPEEFDNKPVTIIGEEVFKDKNLEKVKFPNSVKIIQDNAFRNNDLTNVELPNELEEVGRQAFFDNQIKNLKINSKFRTYGSFVFDYNPIEKIIVDDNNNYFIDIDENGMYSENGKNLIIGTNSGEISDGTEVINQNAFFGRGISGIIDIPDSVTTIQDEAFTENEIEKLNLSNSVTYLGMRAFSENNIKTLIIPKNLTELMNMSFRNNNLETVYLYNKDVMIDDNVFIDNPNNLVIRGYEGSTAETYAEAHNHSFEPFHIPDDNLRKAINVELGESESYEPTLNDLKSLTELDAYDYGIKDLTGLEHAINLEHYLELGDNEINDISALENLTRLEALLLNGNQISDISALESLTRLEVLDLYGNQISDISVLKNLTRLEELYLDGNQISDISALENLTNLWELDLSENGISDISALENLTSLVFLYIGENHIIDLSPLSSFFNNLRDGYLSEQTIKLPEVSLLESDTELEIPNPVRDYYGDVLKQIDPDNGDYDEDSEMIRWEGLTGSAGDTTYLTFTFDDDDYGFTGTVTQPIKWYSMTEVELATPEFTEATCDNPEVGVETPEQDGVFYQVQGDIEEGSTITVTATPGDNVELIATDGWTLGDGFGFFEHTFAELGDCEKEELTEPEPEPEPSSPDGDTTITISDDSKEDGNDEDDRKKLPKTATNNFNMIGIGLGLILIGGVAFVFIRRKAL